MPRFEEFGDIVRQNVPLAPFTNLKIGGPAEFFIQPRSRGELAQVLQRCAELNVPFRVLGGGCNLLVRDEGVRGVVLRLSEPAFTQATKEQGRLKAGTGATLARLIAEAARQGLAGLELLIGIPGTVGGALRSNAGDRMAEIGQFIRLVEVMDARGEVSVRERDELRFGTHWSNLDDPVLLAAELDLEPDSPDAIGKRLLKTWIQRKATQPLLSQPSARLFKDPRGLRAAALIEQAGLGKTRVGGAEISERGANYVVAHPGVTARDVLRLIDLVRSRVQEQFGTELEPEVAVW